MKSNDNAMKLSRLFKKDRKEVTHEETNYSS